MEWLGKVLLTSLAKDHVALKVLLFVKQCCGMASAFGLLTLDDRGLPQIFRWNVQLHSLLLIVCVG